MTSSARWGAWLGVAGVLVAGCTGQARTDSRAVIHGRVLLRDVAGASDLSRVRVDIGRGEGGVAPDEQGYFEFTDVEPDTYQLTITYTGGLTPQADKSAYERYEARVVARAGSATEVGDIAPILARAPVSGTVTAPQDVDTEGAEVTLEAADGTRRVVTLAGGAFRFEEVPVGYYGVSVQRPGLAHPAAQTAQGCVSPLTVTQGEDEVAVDAIPVVGTRVGLDYAAGEVVDTQVDASGIRWFVLPRGADGGSSGGSVTVRVDAPFAARARTWLNDDTPGAYAAALPAYGISLTGSTTVFHAQFKDPCSYESEVYSVTLIHDAEAPLVTAPRVDGAAESVRARAITVELVASDALSDKLEMQLVHCAQAAGTACDLSASSWVPYQRQNALVLDDAQGNHVISARVRDRSGNPSAILSTSVVHDSVPPQNAALTTGTMNNVVATTTPVVHPSADGATLMKVGTVSGLATLPWIPMAPAITVDLGPGDGDRTLYARYRDGAGNETNELVLVVTVDTRGDITGVVELSGGAPPAGSVIQLVGSSFMATADATGAFSLRAPAASYTMVVSAPAPGADAWRTHTEQVRIDAGRANDRGVIVLTPKQGTISGRVTLEDSTDAGGVFVEVLGTAVSASTSTTGDFILGGVVAGTHSIRFSRSGYENVVLNGIVVTDRGQATPGGDVAMVRKRGSARGVVALEGAADALGATVVVPGTSLVANVAASGAWTLTGIPEGPATFSISGPATGNSYVGVQVFGNIVAGAETAVQDVTLRRVRNDIRGTFTLEEGTDHSGIVVTVEGADMAGVTTSTGTFTISGVPEGTWTVTASRGTEYSSVSRSVTVSATQSPAATGQLALVRTAEIATTVTLEDGTAPTGALVTLSGTDFRGRTVSPRTQTAPASGALTFSALLAGTYALHAELTGFRAADSTLILNTGAMVTAGPLALGVARGSARGTVSAAGATSQAGTTIIITGATTRTTVTDSAGAWSAEGLREATGYTVTAQRDGYTSATSATFSVAQDATQDAPSLALVLATNGAISGNANVATPAGPHSGITVTATGEDVNGAAVTSSTTTNTIGAYTLSNLKQGTYTLDFTKDGHDGQQVRNVIVRAGDTATAPDVVLPVSVGSLVGTAQLTAGTVSGFVVGTDHSGIVVTLSDALGTLQVAVTDGSGGYRFDDVPVSLSGAAYTVRATRPFFRAAQDTVTVVADSSTPVNALTLGVDAASATGTVQLRDDVGGAGNLNSTHGGVTLAFSGVAFNGRSFTTSAVSASNGSYTLPPIPPGSYDVTITSTNRNCGPALFRALAPAEAWAMGTTTCTDTAAPTGLSLAAVPAYSNTTAGTLSIALATPATDPTTPTSNLRGYQLGTGSPVTWNPTPVSTGPFAFTVSTNNTNIFSVRAIDFSGNTGPASTVTVIHDGILPPVPVVITPRAIVDATTTSITLSGSETDVNFDHYEICTVVLPFASAQPSSCGGTFTRTAASFALSLAADQRTWLFARALDRAANASGDRVVGITSDLTRPTAPVLAPQFDPTSVTLRAQELEIHISTAPADVPVTGGNWKGIAYVEVDVGDGYAPVCALSSCLVGGDTWDPCNCSCGAADAAKLICTTETVGAVTTRKLTGLKLRTRPGVANRMSIRGVDLAGNPGEGASVSFVPEDNVAYDTSPGPQAQPVLKGTLLAFVNDQNLRVHRLDGSRHQMASDITSSYCDVGVGRPRHGDAYSDEFMERAVFIQGGRLVHAAVDTSTNASSDSSVIRRTPTGFAGFCSYGEDVKTLRRVLAPARVAAVAPLGVDGAAWVERTNYTGEPNGDDSKLVYAWRGPGMMLEDPTDDVVALLGAAAGGPTTARQAFLSGGGDHVVYATGYHTGDAACPAPGTNGLGDVGCRDFNVHYVPPTVTDPLPPASSFSAMVAVMDADRNRLLLVRPSGSDLVVELRTPGADRIITSGAGSNDDSVIRTITGYSAASYAAIQGNHVVVVAQDASRQNALVDWNAGGDGTFSSSTSSDDEINVVLTTYESVAQPALSEGVVFYVGNGVYAGDLVVKDLTQFKWLTMGMLDVVTNGNGVLLGSDLASTGIVARAPDGSRTRKTVTLRPRTSGFPPALSARGSLLAYATTTTAGTDIFVHGAGADGTFFAGGDDSSTLIAQVANPRQVARLDLFDGALQRLLVVIRQPGFPDLCEYRVFQGNQLLTASTSVARVNELCPQFDYSAGQGPFNLVFDAQSPGNGASVFRVIRDEDRNGSFSQAEMDAVGTLIEPGGYSQQWEGIHYVRVDGDKLVADRNGSRTVVWAGNDGVFDVASNGNDTRQAAGGTAGQSDPDMVLVGGSLYSLGTPGSGGGTQVYRFDISSGVTQQVTNYYSTKRELRADPSGLVLWSDSVAPLGVMALTP